MVRDLIHYHGGPITPQEAALACWQGRHACISFAAPDQLPIAAEVCQSFMLDNGAFSMWKAKTEAKWADYYAFVDEWLCHPGFDWAVIPDVIDGDESVNDAMLKEWPFGDVAGVPVWHLHESLERLTRLCTEWPRVALGSSGAWATVGNDSWWQRMARAMEACTIQGRPMARLHGLRMLNVEVYRHLPLSSADSTNVARNVGLDNRWTGTYKPQNKAMRAAILTHRIESHNSSPSWIGGPIQEEFFGETDDLFSGTDQRLQ
jgi:hypothetical protein